jgi:UDP-N-acetylglucosamine diphosphorylase/glucosamine-1-phosphate N-acetyltransferase
MAEAKLAIFDDGLGRWGPLTRLRPIFDQRMGRLTLRERIERVLDRPADVLSVPERLAAVTEARADPCPVNEPLGGGDWLVVNGRWAALEQVDRVRSLARGQALADAGGGLIAARLEAAAANRLLDEGATVAPEAAATEGVDPTLLTRPWHLLDRLKDALAADLADPPLPSADYHALREVTLFGQHRVYLGEGARIDPGVVLDCENGPIAIDAGARIRPRALIEGPCAIGASSEIAGHGYIRPNAAIGPGCKIGGEVSASIIQAHTNKAHAGYLGDSIVGAWCNLGASTVVSNLKNTYGEVRTALESGSDPEPTGRTRLGPIIGDFVRTAIGTRLLTGSVVDVGCMLATSGFAPKCAPPLGFYTDAGRAEHELDKLLTTLNAMMHRREARLDAATIALLRGLV